MNRSADRIRLMYALLLSLIVTAMSLAFVAPSQAAAPLIYLTATSTTSPSPGPTPTLDGGPQLIPKLEEKEPTLDTPTGGGTGTESPSTGGPATGDTPSGETPAPAPAPEPNPQPDPVESSPGDGSSSGGTDNGGTTPEPPPAGEPNTDTPTTNPGPAPGGQVEQPAGPVEDPSTGTTDPGTPNTGNPVPSGPQEPANPPSEPAPGDPEPPLTLDPDVDSGIVAGEEVKLNLDATGGTGDATYRVVSGALPPGLSLDPETGLITGTVKHVGKHSFTVKVISGNVSTTHKYTIVVKERPLDIEAPPLEPAHAGEPYEPVVLHTDGGKGPFTYSLKGSELAGAEADPAPVQSSHWIGTAPNTLTGSSKLFDSGPTLQGVADSKSGGTVAGSSSKIGNLPAGMRLEGGVLTGQPEAHAAGTYTFTIVSTDRFGSTAEQEMTITVLSDGDPVPIPAGEVSETGSPAELAGNDVDDGSRAAAAVPAAQIGSAPLFFGVVVLGMGGLFLFLRRRFTTGTHQ